MRQNFQNLSILILFFPLHARSQNLVRNPGFEYVSTMPTVQYNAGNCAKGWRVPTYSGSDYYHMDAEKGVSTPKNRFGKQAPHSGKAYGGICIRKQYIEYLATNLWDTLTKGQDYLVELYISRAERSVSSVNEFGILFSNKINQSMSQQGITQIPSVDFKNAKGFKNKKKMDQTLGSIPGPGL